MALALVEPNSGWMGPIPSLSYAPIPHIPVPSTLTDLEIDYIALLDVDVYEPLGLWEILETFQQLRPDVEQPVAVVGEAVCRLLGRRLIDVYTCRRFPQRDVPLPIDEAIALVKSASAWLKPGDLRFVSVELELTVAG